MSTECNKALEDAERQRDYYKEMYEMRTEAYITLHRQYDALQMNYDVCIGMNGKSLKYFAEEAIKNGSLK